MTENLISVKLSEKNKDRLINECKEVFLEAHPEFSGMYLTTNFMLEKVIEYYLQPSMSDHFTGVAKKIKEINESEEL